MVRSTSRLLGLLMVGLLLPIVAIATPVSASHEDECAGGVDASNDEFNPTPLEVYAGCAGRLYNAPDDSTNHDPDDFRDVYSIRVDGTGTAYMDWQLCNNAKTGYLFYDVYWDSDVLPRKRVAVGGIWGGDCTSEKPQVLSGNYKPGDWDIILYSYESEIAENKNLDYMLYAQPLWR